MRKTNEKNNKGFSLVELIVVIAIMIVLVAVLAPVFTKYVEQSRRATDVTNANAIAEAVLVDAAEGTVTAGTDVEVKDGNALSAVKSAPTTKGDAVEKGKTFSYNYNKDSNTVNVFVTSDTTKTNLASEQGAEAYKNDATADDKQVTAPAASE